MVQVKVIADSQRSIGLDWKSGSLMQRIRSGARILSILVSWALEDAVITADSMRARGYGQHKRSTFSIFRFGKKDAKMLTIILVLFAAEIFTYLSGRGTMEFYPAMVFPEIDFTDILIYVLYITLGILPAVIQIKEDLKWKLLK
jgi:energy-coupling factor transport system permease protein